MYIQKKKINQEIPRSRNHWFFAIKKNITGKQKNDKPIPPPHPNKKRY